VRYLFNIYLTSLEQINTNSTNMNMIDIATRISLSVLVFCLFVLCVHDRVLSMFHFVYLCKRNLDVHGMLDSLYRLWLASRLAYHSFLLVFWLLVCYSCMNDYHLPDGSPLTLDM